MRRKALIISCLFFVCSTLSVFSQNKDKIDLSLNNVTLKEFFSTVEKKLGYSFMYSNVDIDDSHLISVEEKGGNINTLLDKAFKNQPISYEITSNKIILKKTERLTNQQVANLKKVKGTILDEYGEPAIGVSVIVKGSPRGTITDIDGNFDIEATRGETLLVSYVGFLKQELKVNEKNTFDIKLEKDNKLLDEVVVIGYGTLRKSDLTGALSSVDTKDLDTRATANVAEALQGIVAGVNVQRNSGIAGDDVAVKIRGVNTFGSNDPLYIIDGFPGQVNSVNPNDIASMEILKDAAAAAIYGSIAANGVVIITTKNGQAGKTQIDINSFASVTQTAKRLEMLDADGYVAVHQRMYDEYNKYASSPVDLPGYLSAPGVHNTNWQDEVFRTGFATTQSAAVRGGQNDTQYSLSANLTDEKGVVISNTFTKQNARMKIKTKKNIFTIDGNMAVTAIKSRRPNFSLKEVYMISPLVPVHDESQEGGFGLTNWGDLPNNVNVIAQDHYVSSWRKKQNIAANIAVGVDITKALSFKTSYSYSGNNEQYYRHNPAYVADVKNPYEYPAYEEYRSYWEEQVFDNLLNYTQQIGKHSINSMVGTSLILNASTWNTVGVEGKKTVYSVNNGSIVTSELPAGFPDPYFMTIDAGKGGTFSADGSKFKYNRMSYFGRLNYSYDSRYLLQFTFRRDGSSKFGRDSRYGNFPSLALGWRINEEAFFPKNSAVSNLKLRASWGKLGNEVALGYYDHQALIRTYNNLFLGYVQGDGNNPWPGSIATGLENRSLQWETTVSKNLGFDYGFLNNAITGSINYFNNTTEDLLIIKKMAPSAGLDDPILNVGKIRNSGLEFEFTYNKTSGDFQYSLGFNVSTLKNEVVSLADKNQILLGTGLKFDTEHFPNQTRVGHPIGAFFLYKTDGIFQSQEEVNAHSHNGKLIQEDAKPGDIRFVDVNGDGVIDDDDKQYCGTGIPKVEVNFNLRASYKGFDASALIGSGWGHKLYNGNKYYYEGMNSGSNFLKSTLDAWTPENRNTSIPRAVLQDPNGNTRESDRFLESGDFIRLRQIQIGYTLPKRLLTQIRSENLRVYVSGENLFTWTKYDGIDPEFAAAGTSSTPSVLNTGVDRLIFPFTRSYVLGLQFTF